MTELESLEIAMYRELRWDAQRRPLHADEADLLFLLSQRPAVKEAIQRARRAAEEPLRPERVML